MVKLLGLLQSEKLVSQGASQQMLAHLNACEDRSRIVRFLPAGTVVAHKSGSVSASRCDAGIVMSPAGPIAMCILTYKIEDRSWDDNNAADLFCANIAKSAYEYFNEGKPAESGPPILRVGANGLLVEALQRTLNERMVPSPGIGVDGDFGPQTEEAVKAFQRGNQLADTGEVGPETWAALGPLSSEAPVPDPEVLNSAKIEKAPEEDLQAPPLTTCHAWVIGDGETGEILWSLNPDEVRDIASTTKIMTGYLVANLAQQDTAILDEVVTFSARADETEGSSARVRTGEQLPVRELLYGLLLPSGNDASVALAEQFGRRLSSPTEGADKVDSYACFIAAMNAKAQELGMKNTSFRNPNGLPEEGHHSTAADLLKLSYAAMQLPLFREYVGTVQHGYAVTGPGGYQRNLQWNNTNRLLKIEGYQGIKTGTTNAAGACLVSQATRGDRTLLAVVLGATTSDGRYIDSRNLYRWAWQQLEQGNGPQ
jgi:D-alanyl-D-alanine carboxypeptidase (penicillin-binding protein 5/6)